MSTYQSWRYLVLQKNLRNKINLVKKNYDIILK